MYQLTAFFTARRGQPLQVYVRVPLKPMENYAMFSLFIHKSLPTISGDRVVRIHGANTILDVGPESAQFTELNEAQLQTCTKNGETFLCGFKHTWTLDPSTSCLAAIYFQNAGAIQLRCRVTTESAVCLLYTSPSPRD